MTIANPTDEELAKLLREAKTIAVVGASSRVDRPSNDVFGYLLRAGYRVFPVNPNEREVWGRAAYPSLEALPERADIVDVFRRAELTPPVARDAVAHGARALWLQLGVVNDEAASIARNGGLTVIMDACIKVVHEMLI
jgi:predicted CoA-binding protein